MTTFSTVEETLLFAQQWATVQKPGTILALHGDLGAGKTVIVKGIAMGLDFDGDVTSPTFTLFHQYEGGRLPLYHFDLYRLENENAASRIGMEEYLPSGGITVIEWPERIAGLLPAGTLHWHLSVTGETSRTLKEELL